MRVGILGLSKNYSWLPNIRIGEDRFIESRVEPESKMENTEYFVG
jgi:hypothetical protein